MATICLQQHSHTVSIEGSQHTHKHTHRPSQQRLPGQHCRLFSCTYYYHLLLLLHSVRPCLSLCSQHHYYCYCHGVLVLCIDLVSQSCLVAVVSCRCIIIIIIIIIVIMLVKSSDRICKITHLVFPTSIHRSIHPASQTSIQPSIHPRSNNK